jgi:WD40 repeat protein
VAIASDGTWLATGGDDRTVQIWDTDSALHLAAGLYVMGTRDHRSALRPPYDPCS